MSNICQAQNKTLLILISGGSRSGKTRLAEGLKQALGNDC